MRIDDIILLIVIIFNSILGLLVLTRKASLRNLIFVLVIFFLNAYFVLNTLIDYVSNYENNLNITRLLFFVSTYLPYFLNIFIYSFATQNRKITKWFLLLSLPITILISVISLVTGAVVSDVDMSIFPVKVIRGDLYYLFYGYIIIQIIFALYQSMRTLALIKGIERLQFRYFISGAILMMLLILLTNVILPTVGITYFVRLPGLFSVIFTSFCTFAIVRHQLFSIKTLIIRILKVIFLGLLFLFVVIALRYFKDGILHVDQFSYEAILLDSIFSLIVATITPSFLKKVDEKLNQIIKPELYFLSNLVNRIEENIELDLDEEQITNLILEKLKESFVYSKIYIIRIDEKNVTIMPNPDLLQNVETVKELKVSSLLLFDEIKEPNDLIKNLMSQGVNVVGKITDKQYIIFSNKVNKEVYTATEISVLKEVLNKLKDIYQKVNIYQEMKGFNVTLQRKVDEATHELQSKNTLLQEQLRKEKDMMDILGHELRTPLSIARNAILMMQTSINQIKETETQQQLTHLLEKATENIRREVKILETVLSSTRIENNRLQISFEKVDMKDVINDTIEGNMAEATKKNLKLYSELPADELFVSGGRDQIQEVVDNLVSNAIKYTQTGEIKLQLTKDNDNGILSVIDTGEGIPEDAIPNLGKKFYRVNPYLQDNDEKLNIIRPGGTGIGLYVVFNLVKMMKGTINIQSKVGEGSNFTIKLPLYKIIETPINK